MVIRSVFPDVEIPDEPLTGFVLARAGEFGDTAALIDAPTAERSRPPNSRRCCSPIPPPQEPGQSQTSPERQEPPAKEDR